MSVTLRLVDDEAGLDALATDWTRLADGGGAPPALDRAARTDADDVRTSGVRNGGVFNGWSWNRLWWRHYGHLGTLHVLVGESDDGVVRGIAPFYHTRSRLLRLARVTTLRFVGGGGDTAPDDLDLLVETGWQDAFADAVCAHLLPGTDDRSRGPARFARFELRDLPSDSVFAVRLLARAATLDIVAPDVAATSRLVDELPRDVATWRASASRNARKQLRRRRNRLAEAGRATFSHCLTAAEIDAAHAALVALHRARRAALGGTAAFDSVAYVEFHRALMHALAGRDELRLGVLALDGRPIAVEYAFAVRGTLAFFQTGFDPAHATLGPGHLLMHWMIERGIEEGLARIDLLKGDYDYKRRYASLRCETRSIDLVVSPRLARLVRGARRVRDAVTRR